MKQNVTELYADNLLHLPEYPPPSGNDGAFMFRYQGIVLTVMSSDGMGWEHVSVSVVDRKGRAVKRTPHWDEMCYIKGLFWNENEVVVQYHPAKSEYVNEHDHCLHLWRPVGVDLPTPPRECV